MRITRELLKKKRACWEGLAAFVARFPDGAEADEALAWTQEIRRCDWARWLVEELGIPYTGRIELWYADGHREWRETYVAGERDGVAERWYDNGQLARRETWKAGKPDGLVEHWAEGETCE